MPNLDALKDLIREKHTRQIKKHLGHLIGNYHRYGHDYTINVIKELFLANPGYFFGEIYPQLRKLLKKSTLPNPIHIEQQIFEDVSLLWDELIVTEFWGKISDQYCKISGMVTLTTHRVIIFGDLKPTAKGIAMMKMQLAQINARKEALAIRRGVTAQLDSPPCFGYCFPMMQPTKITTTRDSMTYEHILATPGDFGWKSGKRKIKIYSKNFYGTGILNKFRRVITRNEERDSLTRAINVCKTCGGQIRRGTKFCSTCGARLP